MTETLTTTTTRNTGTIRRLLLLIIPLLLIFNLLPLETDFSNLSLQDWRIAPPMVIHEASEANNISRVIIIAPTMMPAVKEANDTSPIFAPTAIIPAIRREVNDGSAAAATVFAFMTEPRCLAAVPFVLKNALDRLPPSFPVVFFHSSHNANCVERWLNETPALWQAERSGRLIIEQESHMDPDAKNIYSPSNWNNVLYTNITFWESLLQYGNTALTIQADTLICLDGGHSNNSSSSSNYTPPWNVNFLGGISWVNDVLPSNATNTYHLNGGLSIRKLDWVISCLRQKRPEDFSTPEDDIFCNCTGGIEVVSVVDAMMFASDNGHTNCFDWHGHRRCPWGVHKPWMRRGDGYRELVRYCPDIEILQKLLQMKSFA